MNTGVGCPEETCCAKEERGMWNRGKAGCSGAREERPMRLSNVLSVQISSNRQKGLCIDSHSGLREKEQPKSTTSPTRWLGPELYKFIQISNLGHSNPTDGS